MPPPRDRVPAPATEPETAGDRRPPHRTHMAAHPANQAPPPAIVLPPANLRLPPTPPPPPVRTVPPPAMHICNILPRAAPRVRARRRPTQRPVGAALRIVFYIARLARRAQTATPQRRSRAPCPPFRLPQLREHGARRETAARLPDAYTQREPCPSRVPPRVARPQRTSAVATLSRRRPGAGTRRRSAAHAAAAACLRVRTRPCHGTSRAVARTSLTDRPPRPAPATAAAAAARAETLIRPAAASVLPGRTGPPHAIAASSISTRRAPLDPGQRTRARVGRCHVAVLCLQVRTQLIRARMRQHTRAARDTARCPAACVRRAAPRGVAWQQVPAAPRRTVS